MPERILYLVNSFEPDAPNRLMLTVAEAASASGRYECLTVACSRSGSLREEVERRSGPTICLSLRGMGQLSAIRKLRQVVSEHQPSIVHATLVRPTILGVPVARSCAVPCIVVTQNGTHEWREGGPLVAPFMPWVFRGAVSKASAVVAVSDSVRANLIEAGIGPGMVRTIYNGVDTTRFRPASRKEKLESKKELCPDDDPERIVLVGAAGNLRKIKGHWSLVKSAEQVCARNAEARFVIWGEGPERHRLEETVRNCGLAGLVSLPGLSTNMPKLFTACDVFVQPSLEEAFGMAAAEAMCCGIAVVASAVGGLPELIEDGHSGLLSTPGNPDELAEKICRLLDDEALRSSLGDRARDRVLKYFSAARMSSEYVALYSSLRQSGGHKCTNSR